MAAGRGRKPAGTNGADLRRQRERDVLRLEDGEITSQPLEVNKWREGGVMANEKSNPRLLRFLRCTLRDLVCFLSLSPKNGEQKHISQQMCEFSRRSHHSLLVV